jgi:hypothetical protein
MMNHIDLGSVLQQTLTAKLYSNLVTRPTGAAVRTQIDVILADAHSDNRALTVLDFSHVTMIDFSCADEIIAKLLLSHRAHPTIESYLVFRGMTEVHWEAVETVLEKRGLALVVERDEGVDLVGVLAELERRTWQAMKRRGRAHAGELASELGEPEDVVGSALEGLWNRRLIMRLGDVYMPVGAIA